MERPRNTESVRNQQENRGECKSVNCQLTSNKLLDGDDAFLELVLIFFGGNQVMG